MADDRTKIITQANIINRPLYFANLKVKYFYPDMPKLENKIGSNWIDLYTAEEESFLPGDFKLVPLGVGIILPEGCEAIIAMRSSTYKKYRITQTNGIGIIDNEYCGEEDQWKLPVKAERSVTIPAHTRLCQFRILTNQPVIMFDTVDHLKDDSRGGFGSTGN